MRVGSRLACSGRCITVIQGSAAANLSRMLIRSGYAFGGQWLMRHRVVGKRLITRVLCAATVAWTCSGCLRQNANTVGAAIQCAQLYELKKQRYWGDEVGNNKYMFSSALNTCLALNIYNNFQTKSYFAMVIDMSTDKTLLYYSDDPKGVLADGEKVITCDKRAIHLSYTLNGREVKESGCERFDLMDKMFERVKALGFEL